MEEKNKKRIAVVRLRGSINVSKKVKDTLNMLRLYKRNGCVVIPNTPYYIGMIIKTKDYITWGEIDEQTFLELVKQRGRIVGNKLLTEEYLKDKTKLSFDQLTKNYFAFKIELKQIPGLKLFFKLKPPAKGFERKGIKTPYSMGGALGYRKDKINDLIRRML